MKLLLMTPDNVYKELKQYGEFLKGTYFCYNEELEKSLLDRNDKLINLALAQFAGSDNVVLELYRKAQQRNDNEKEYNLALRIACLSNVVASMFMHGFLEKVDVEELIGTDAEDAIDTYLSNPNIPEEQLENIFRKKGIFENLELNIWIRLINYSAKNVRLKTDKSWKLMDYDYRFRSLHKSIFEMLETVPTTKHTLEAIYDLLFGLDPDQVHSPDELQHVIDRWRSVELLDDNGKVAEGYFTSLNIRDEFLCLVASLYGKSSSKEMKIFGSANSNDIVLRCAHYGNADMTLEEMKAAYEHDEAVFTYAAIANSNLYHKRQRREFLEGAISERKFQKFVRDNYDRRLESLFKERFDRLDAKYASFAEFAAFDSDESSDCEDKAPTSEKSAELTGIQQIVPQQAIIEKQLRPLKIYLFWAR
jgi:hypothetical protein